MVDAACLLGNVTLSALQPSLELTSLLAKQATVEYALRIASA